MHYTASDENEDWEFCADTWDEALATARRGLGLDAEDMERDHDLPVSELSVTVCEWEDCWCRGNPIREETITITAMNETSD